MFKTYLQMVQGEKKWVCFFICRGEDKANVVKYIHAVSESTLKGIKVFIYYSFNFSAGLKFFKVRRGKRKIEMGSDSESSNYLEY